MGTNYYYTTREELPDERITLAGHKVRVYKNHRLHIGKSSAGWAFALHVYPEDYPRNYDHWIDMLHDGGRGRIVDEYGEELTVEEMLAVILERGDPGELRHHPKDGEHCIAQATTFDYCIGDFS